MNLERRLLDLGPAARRAVERRVDVTVLRFGAALERVGIREIADDRMRAALGRRAGPSRCRARAPSRRGRLAPARRVLRRRCIRSHRSGRSASRAYIIVQSWLATPSSIFSRTSRRLAATSSCTTTASGAGRTRTRQIARMARHLRRAHPRRRTAQGRHGRLLEREPAGVDRRVLGLPAPRRRRRADRLPLVAGLSPARQPHRVRQARARRPGRAAAARGSRGTRGAGLAAARARLARTPSLPLPRPSRSRATTSPRSSSRPARPPSPRASSSRTATSSPTSCRSSARC